MSHSQGNCIELHLNMCITSDPNQTDLDNHQPTDAKQ